MIQFTAVKPSNVSRLIKADNARLHKPGSDVIHEATGYFTCTRLYVRTPTLPSNHFGLSFEALVHESTCVQGRAGMYLGT